MLSSQTKFKIVLIITLCTVTCGLVLGMVSCTSRGFGSFPAYSNDISIGDDEAKELRMMSRQQEPLSSFDIPADEVSDISIDWATGAVVVRAIEDADSDGMVHLTEYVRGSGKQQPMGVNCENGLLSIRYKARFSLFGGCSFASKVAIVELPKAVAESIGRFDLDGASGRYELSDLKCKSFKLQLASGNVTCESISADDVEINLASGSLDAKAEIARQLTVQIASGDVSIYCEGASPDASDIKVASGTMGISFEDGAPASSTINMTSGNLVFAFPEGNGFEATLHKVSGSLACDIPCDVATDSYYASGDRSSHIDISLISGNVELKALRDGKA